VSIIRIFWNMTSYMLRWGVLGGAVLGALYGIVIAFTIFVDYERGSIFIILPRLISSSVMLGAPFGALFGGIAGAVIGIASGVSVGLLTRMIFSLSRNWGWYRLSVGLVSVGFALVGGLLVFNLFMPSYTIAGFMLMSGIPSLVAAVVFGHASQRAAKRHLVAVTASNPYYQP
jgi:hypothetical protein